MTTGMIEWGCRHAFFLLSMAGRRFGGLRPQRLQHVLAGRGFPTFSDKDFFWIRDRSGFEISVNPFYLIDRDIVWSGAYEYPLHLLIDGYVRPGMACLDIGANIGSISLHLAKNVGSTGIVHAIEPAPSLRGRLVANLERNQLQGTLRVHPIAITARSGAAKLRFAKLTEMNQGMGTLTNATHAFLTEQSETPAMTLDDFVTTNNLVRLDFLKADIQGAEYDMLKGGRDTLRRFRPLMVLEVSPEDLAMSGVTPIYLFELLHELGYRIRALDAGGRFGATLSARDVSESQNVVCEPLI